MTPRVRLYAEEIGFWHGVKPRAIMSRSQKRPVAHARGDVMRRLRRDGFTTTQIGKWMGRNHATVVYWTRPEFRARRLGRAG